MDFQFLICQFWGDYKAGEKASFGWEIDSGLVGTGGEILKEESALGWIGPGDSHEGVSGAGQSDDRLGFAIGHSGSGLQVTDDREIFRPPQYRSQAS